MNNVVDQPDTFDFDAAAKKILFEEFQGSYEAQVECSTFPFNGTHTNGINLDNIVAKSVFLHLGNCVVFSNFIVFDWDAKSTTLLCDADFAVDTKVC